MNADFENEQTGRRNEILDRMGKGGGSWRHCLLLCHPVNLVHPVKIPYFSDLIPSPKICVHLRQSAVKSPRVELSPALEKV
jgi:hypothetical protein